MAHSPRSLVSRLGLKKSPRLTSLSSFWARVKTIHWIVLITYTAEFFHAVFEEGVVDGEDDEDDEGEEEADGADV